LKFEENLREARKQYGYLQEELADKLNVSRQVVSKCTKGAQSRKMEVPILSWIS
jgi:DNA-binding XRE family transcriptional regulator